MENSMTSSNNPFDAESSSSIVDMDQEVLSPVIMCDWIKAEIDRLKEEANDTLFEAQALERQMVKVAQFMQDACEKLDKVSDVSAMHLANTKALSINNKPSIAADFMLIGPYVKDLLKKVIRWKVQRQPPRVLASRSIAPRAREEDVKKEQQKKTFHLNPALKKPVRSNTNYQSTLCLYTPPRTEDEDDERLIKIPQRRVSTPSDNTMMNIVGAIPKKLVQVPGTSRKNLQIATKSPEMKSKQQNIVEETQKEAQNQVKVKQEVIDVNMEDVEEVAPVEAFTSSEERQEREENATNKVAETVQNRDKPQEDERCFQQSLRIESLGDIFAKDSEDIILAEVEKMTKVKEEVQEEEEKTTNADEYESSEDEKEEEDEEKEEGEIEEEEEENEKGQDENREKENRMEGEEEEEGNGSASSTDTMTTPLPEDIQQDQQSQPNGVRSSPIMQQASSNLATKQIKPREDLQRIHSQIKFEVNLEYISPRKHKLNDVRSNGTSGTANMRAECSLIKRIKTSPEDNAYSEFSQAPASLPWHRNQPSTSTSKPKPTYSSKIKKKRRVDYEEEQKAMNRVLKKNRKVHFCLEKNNRRNFQIDDGNFMHRYGNYPNDCNHVHDQISTRFMKGTLGPTTLTKSAKNARQLSVQMQKDIKSMVETVMERLNQVHKQNEEIEKLDKEIPMNQRIVRLTRLLVTDSMLARIDKQAFRNLQILKLEPNRDIDMLTTGFEKQREYIFHNLSSMEFSYIFFLYGSDTVSQGHTPSIESVLRLRNWFKTHLAPMDLQKSNDDEKYAYQVPLFVLITIPEIGPVAANFRAFNQELRKLVQKNSDDFLLIDWAKRVDQMPPESLMDERVVQVLVCEMAEYGVLVH